MQIETKHPRFGYTVGSLAIASVLWAFIFLADILNFWYRLASATSVLMIITYFGNNRAFRLDLKAKYLALGLISGLFLYVFFLIGFNVARDFAFIVRGAESVYFLKSGLPIGVIGTLLLFPISPAEEIFWRGLIQKGLILRMGPMIGYAVATLSYSLVHLPTFNVPLILVALIAGLVWGYLFLQTGSVTPGVISHVIFNEMIFVLFPIS